MGGLARKATIIADIKSEGIKPFIVDAGDLFFKNDGKTAPSLIAPDTIVESYNWIGCHAFSPGSKDFALGRKFLESLENKSNFPYISCNIYTLESDRLFEPYVEHQFDETKIIIIGAASSFGSDEVTVTDPIKELELLIPMLKKNSSDFVLLLFNASEIDMNRLQKSDINVDMVIRSKKKSRSSDGGTKRIPVYMAGDRGKYVYRIDIEWDGVNKVVDVPKQKGLIRFAENRLNRMKKEGYGLDQLEEAYNDNPDALKNIQHYKTQIANAREKISLSKSTLNMTKIELDKKVMDTPEILAIVDRGLRREQESVLPK